jgi:hypothetical protein
LPTYGAGAILFSAVVEFPESPQGLGEKGGRGKKNVRDILIFVKKMADRLDL